MAVESFGSCLRSAQCHCHQLCHGFCGDTDHLQYFRRFVVQCPAAFVGRSLALGATKWQTLIRLVIISASPGIFSALMIGFGRAVGETMIVLMATGNTPILDWSMFNGFRTLSANIAVEMPEAPHGGTLYRVLFLSGLILFGFTFVLTRWPRLCGSDFVKNIRNINTHVCLSEKVCRFRKPVHLALWWGISGVPFDDWRSRALNPDEWHGVLLA
ncbi:MAG: ABC transporter permease subunit [Nitrospirales bacterium]|nr:ABC transporter permease subunit [Nitrospirales bacterium]